jgi:uncharacterized protein YecT (DUF1311 family)
VPIAIAPPAEQEAPLKSAGKLQTLPPEAAPASSAKSPATARTPSSDGAAADASVTTSPHDENAGPPAVSPQVALPSISPAPAPAPAAPQPRASFDCATARPGAERMVCSDPELAAEDRQLARAYRRALRYGDVDPADLRQEQRDWMGIREDAARHSRRALADVYDQRLQELDAIAGRAPGGPEGPPAPSWDDGD